MPKGPRGEKRPADVIGAAVKVMRIATGEETEELAPEQPDRLWSMEDVLALMDAREVAPAKRGSHKPRADKAPISN